MRSAKRLCMLMAAWALLFPLRAAFCGEAAVQPLSPYSTLRPDSIDEFVAPENDYRKLADETYRYRADPKGAYYHFASFVSDGDSQWDGFLYDEHFTASSTLPPVKGITYGPENLRNGTGKRKQRGGKRDVAWCEGVKGYGVGERVNMRVLVVGMYHEGYKKSYFDELMIVNGHAKNDTTWRNNSRVKTLRLYVDGIPRFDLQLRDTMRPQIFNLGEIGRIYTMKGQAIPLEPDGAPGKSLRDIFPVPEAYEPDAFQTLAYQIDLSFEILEVYPGAKYDDTCITGIALNVGYGGVY